jgi:hypothetical protein
MRQRSCIGTPTLLALQDTPGRPNVGHVVVAINSVFKKEARERYKQEARRQGATICHIPRLGEMNYSRSA